MSELIYVDCKHCGPDSGAFGWSSLEGFSAYCPSCKQSEIVDDIDEFEKFQVERNLAQVSNFKLPDASSNSLVRGDNEKKQLSAPLKEGRCYLDNGRIVYSHTRPVPSVQPTLSIGMLETVRREIYYIMGCSGNVEVGGLLCVKLEGGRPMIYKNKMIKNLFNGSGHVQLDPVAMASLVDDPDYPNIRGFWHSHVNMGVSPSSDDLSNTADLLNFSDFIVTLIFNLRGDVYARFDMVTPINYNWPDCKLDITPEPGQLSIFKKKFMKFFNLKKEEDTSSIEVVDDSLYKIRRNYV